ncbi:MAG: enoyl-CoA hydratase [Proteobacteria bacterium]|nr:MAG: enoyl-CoA hydratase [Pseudomonadota bacterium]
MQKSKSNALLVAQDQRGVATLTLNRPDKHNAFDDSLIAALIQQLAQLAEQPNLRVLLLRANGKSFSAGADLNWMHRMADYTTEQNHADALQLAKLMQCLHDFPAPTIAVVQGAAFGGGVGLVACCDMALASADARFSLSEVRLGLIPAVISPYVVRAIGVRAAQRYFLTAERFSAAEALRLGLIHELAASEALLEKRLAAIVNHLLLGGPQALHAAKQLIASVSEQALDPALIAETAKRISHLRASAEGREGLNAFLEKRTPNWVSWVEADKPDTPDKEE